MKVDTSKLPNRVQELREMIRRMLADHEKELHELQDNLQKERNERIEQQNKALEYFEELQLMRRRLFGRSAERLSEEERKQLWLFNEAELIVSSVEKVETEVERVPVRAHTRVKRGRKPLPEDLPRVEVLHDIPEEDKICGCGKRLQRIGEDTCEKLEIIPAQVRVKRHIRPKYACKACEGSGDEEKPAVRIAPAVPQLLPKSIATPSLVAYLITAKFCDALPFFRQERQFQRIGIDISRQDMANWSIRVHHRVVPLLTLLREEIRQGPMVGIDETSVQVMNEPGRANTSQSDTRWYRNTVKVPIRLWSGSTRYLRSSENYEIRTLLLMSSRGKGGSRLRRSWKRFVLGYRPRNLRFHLPHYWAKPSGTPGNSGTNWRNTWTVLSCVQTTMLANKQYAPLWSDAKTGFFQEALLEPQPARGGSALSRPPRSALWNHTYISDMFYPDYQRAKIPKITECSFRGILRRTLSLISIPGIYSEEQHPIIAVN